MSQLNINGQVVVEGKERTSYPTPAVKQFRKLYGYQENKNCKDCKWFMKVKYGSGNINFKCEMLGKDHNIRARDKACDIFKLGGKYEYNLYGKTIISGREHTFGCF